MDNLDHVNVIGDARCVSIIGEHIGGGVNAVDNMEASAKHLEVVHERLGGDVRIYGLGMTELVDPCVLNGVDDEGAATAFGGFMAFEIVSQQLVDNLRAVADDRSGIV